MSCSDDAVRDGDGGDGDSNWELIPAHWWRTSFNAVSWTFSLPPSPARSRRRTGTSARSLAASSSSSSRPSFSSPSRPKSLPTRDALMRRSSRAQNLAVCCAECQELRHPLWPCHGGTSTSTSTDDKIRTDSVGARLTEECVHGYETAVGFSARTRPDADVDTDVDVVALTRHIVALQRRSGARADSDTLDGARAAWQSLARGLFSDATFAPSTSPDSILLPPVDVANLPPILDLDLDPKPESKPQPAPESKYEPIAAEVPPPSTPRPSPARAASSIKEQVDEVLRKFERLHGDCNWQDDRDDAKHAPREPPSPSTTSSSPATSSDDSQSLASFTTATTTRTRSSSLPSVNLRRDEHGFYYNCNPGGDEHSDSDKSSSLHVHVRGRRLPVTPSKSKTKTKITRGEPRVRGDDTDDDGDADGADARGSFSVNRLFQRTSDGWIRLANDADASSDKRRVPRPPPTPSDDMDIDEAWPTLASVPPASKRSSYSRQLPPPQSQPPPPLQSQAPPQSQSSPPQQPQQSQQSAPQSQQPPPQSQPKHHARRASTTDGWIDPTPTAAFSGQQRKQRSRSQQFAQVPPPLPPFGLHTPSVLAPPPVLPPSSAQIPHPPPPPPSSHPFAHPGQGYFVYAPPVPQGFVPMAYPYAPYAPPPPPVMPHYAPYPPMNVSSAYRPNGWL